MHTMVSRMTYMYNLIMCTSKQHVHMAYLHVHVGQTKPSVAFDTSFVAIHYIYYTLAMSRTTHLKRG